MVTNLGFKIEHLLFLEEYNIKNSNVLLHQYKILSQRQQILNTTTKTANKQSNNRNVRIWTGRNMFALAR